VGSPVIKPSKRPTAAPTHLDLYCGAPGQRAGLIGQFSETSIQEIPFNTPVEISFSVTRTGLCHKFTNIEVQLISTCEQNSSNSFKYQYDVVRGPDKIQRIDYSKLVPADSASGSFSVTWASTNTALSPSSGSNRRLEPVAQGKVSLSGEELSGIAVSASAHLQPFIETMQAQIADQQAQMLEQQILAQKFAEQQVQQHAIMSALLDNRSPKFGGIQLESVIAFAGGILVCFIIFRFQAVMRTFFVANTDPSKIGFPDNSEVLVEIDDLPNTANFRIDIGKI